jgi:hypothetical protein
MQPYASMTMMASTADSMTERHRSSLARRARSLYLRALMSRARIAAPITALDPSVIGDIDRTTSISAPLFVRTLVSYCRTGWPSRRRSSTNEKLSCRSLGTRVATDFARMSAAAKPSRRSAPGFHSRIAPSRSVTTIASSDDSRIAARILAASPPGLNERSVRLRA